MKKQNQNGEGGRKAELRSQEGNRKTEKDRQCQTGDGFCQGKENTGKGS